MFAMMFGGIALLTWPSFRHKMALGCFMLFAFPVLAVALVHGEWLGLPVADTDQWGGFMLTMMLAAVGIVRRPADWNRHGPGAPLRTPVIRSLCVFYIELWRAAPLITILFMASNLLPLFFPVGRGL